MGYHKTIQMKKGELGEFSKIAEEYDELLDGKAQDNPVLILCELCDLIGAIEAFSENYYNISLAELIKMKECTKEAFISGERK